MVLGDYTVSVTVLSCLNWDNEFFQRDCFLLVHPVVINVSLYLIFLWLFLLVLLLLSQYWPRDWLGRTSPKRHVLQGDLWGFTGGGRWKLDNISSSVGLATLCSWIAETASMTCQILDTQTDIEMDEILNILFLIFSISFIVVHVGTGKYSVCDYDYDMAIHALLH